MAGPRVGGCVRPRPGLPCSTLLSALRCPAQPQPPQRVASGCRRATICVTPKSKSIFPKWRIWPSLTIRVGRRAGRLLMAWQRERRRGPRQVCSRRPARAGHCMSGPRPAARSALSPALTASKQFGYSALPPPHPLSTCTAQIRDQTFSRCRRAQCRPSLSCFGCRDRLGRRLGRRRHRTALPPLNPSGPDPR